MKKLATVLGAVLLSIALPLQPADAVGELTASVSIPNVTYDGSGCLQVPITLSVSGGVSNGFAYWTTEAESLRGPTSSPYAVSFFVQNEAAPATKSMQLCPLFDHPGVYTYSEHVWFHNWTDQGGDRYAGRVSASFVLSLARTTLAKVGRHAWQVKIVGQPYLVSYPRLSLQKRKGATWRAVRRLSANSAGKVVLKPAPAGKYRLVYAGDADRGYAGSTSTVFRRP